MLTQLKHIRGYSLIELVITITLTSLVMVIFYNVFAVNQKNSVTPVFQVKASELAQAYMEEIALKRFDEASPSGNSVPCGSPSGVACSGSLQSDGESRQLYDDVDDYNGASGTGISDNPPVDALGNTRAGFNGFTVNVLVSYSGNSFTTQIPTMANQDLKQIQVTVITPEGDQFVFSQYRGNF